MVKSEKKQKTLKPAFCHNSSTKDKHDKLYFQGKYNRSTVPYSITLYPNPRPGV